MKVGIVGLGLIGGSIGLALRKPGTIILGNDPDPKAVETALARQCIDEPVSMADFADAEVVFVASPPASITSNLQDLCQTGAVVTDCASVKSDIVAWTKKAKVANFVPGHPMAGHEKSGATYASPWLFRNAKWILCPLSFTDRRAVRKVEELVKSMGANPIRMKPETHDRQVAILSHLPHVMAATLVRLGEDLEDSGVAGGSWRDMTRVAGVDSELWTQILLGNREEVLAVLDQACVDFGRLASALRDRDTEAVRCFFDEATQAKARQTRASPAKPSVPQRKVRRAR